MATKRVHVYYSGRVQGVGFRFAAEAAARKLKVSGWVKNLPDGRVEVVAESDERVIINFLENISGEMSSYIRDAEIFWEQPTGEFKGFGIRFSD